MSHSIDLFVLSISIPSEISILSCSRVFMCHTNNHQEKAVGNIYHLFQRYF